jgi:hypothetical protein
MMKFDDTGLNEPEPMATLLMQQERLTSGKRCAQMFPKGTPELPLPTGMARIETPRGIFHFNAGKISADHIRRLSKSGRENVILELGPYSKSDVVERLEAGEKFVVIAEYMADGTELRAAAGTETTAPIQRMYFERTKADGSTIISGPLPPRIARRA